MKTIDEILKLQFTGNITTPGQQFIPLYTLATDEHVRIVFYAKVTVVGTPNDATSSSQRAVAAEAAGVANSSSDTLMSINGNVLNFSAMVTGIATSGLDLGVMLSFQAPTNVTVEVDLHYSIERL